jgi:hypothetical protein
LRLNLNGKEIDMIVVAFVLFAILLAGWLVAPKSTPAPVAKRETASARLIVSESPA